MSAPYPRSGATRDAIKNHPELLQNLKGRRHLGGYINNPLDEAGRAAIVHQFLVDPLGGHVRRLTGHQLAEQAAAGVLATGVGGWGLLSAIDALNGAPAAPVAIIEAA